MALEILGIIQDRKMIRKSKKNKLFLKNLYNFLEVRKTLLHSFDSRVFLMKSEGLGVLNTDYSKLKILTPKQMLEKLLIALAQVKAGNNSESLLNEIRKIVYLLYQSK